MTIAKPDPELVELGQRVTSGDGTALAVFLASVASGTVSRRLISAVSDDCPCLLTQIQRILSADALTLRRVDWH